VRIIASLHVRPNADRTLQIAVSEQDLSENDLVTGRDITMAGEEEQDDEARQKFFRFHARGLLRHVGQTDACRALAAKVTARSSP
jgi:hypothetical protein